MAINPGVTIKVEFEPVVKIFCKAIDCQFNLVNNNNADNWATCNLKHLTINKDGQCQSYKKDKE